MATTARPVSSRTKWRCAVRSAAVSSLGLYVHIPFCEAKCSYCHFAIDPARPDESRQERYRRAVTAEMEEAAAGPADTLYFGGGTPSLLSIDRLAALVDVARRRFALPADAELTVEANPRDLDGAGYRALVDLGTNRLSLGAQSFDDRVLSEMGRRHTAEDARAAVALARAACLTNLNLDLILGWPGETRAHWLVQLDALIALDPEHVSLYLLEVEGKTALAHRLQKGSLALPQDDLLADLYLETVERLASRGLARYEISNFARPGFESRHNLKYWSDAPYRGFGMSAHSYRDGKRLWNHDRFAIYCRAVEERGPAAAVAGERMLTVRERAAEALFMGLRRVGGVDLAVFRRRHGVEPLVEWASGIETVAAAGLLELRGDCLRLTDRGFLLSSEVFRVFV